MRYSILLGALMLSASASAQPVPAGGAPLPDTASTAPGLLEDLLAAPVELGDSYWTTERDKPASVTIVSAEEIDRYGYETLHEALQHVRGFTTSTDYYNSQISARGLALPDDRGRRLLVMIDGESSHEYIYGSAALEPSLIVPIESLERIEVIRGPGSARYGSGALTLAINLVTKTGARLSGAHGRLTQFGANGTGGHVSLGNDYGGVSWAVTASAHRRYTDVQPLAFADSAGTFDPAADADRDQGYQVFGQLGWKGFRLSVQHGYRDKLVPTGPYGTTLGRTFIVDESRTRATLSLHHRFSPRLSGSAAAFVGRWESHNTAFTQGIVGSLRSGGEDQSRGVHADVSWTPAAWYRLQAGVEGRQHPKLEYSIINGLVSGSGDLAVGAVYAEQEVGLSSRFTLTTGARYDYVGGEVLTRSFSPRAALVYTPVQQTSFKALYTSSFRVPTLYENRNRRDLSNRLRAERLTSGELVWMQRLSSDLTFSTSGYYAWSDGLIAARPGQIGFFSQVSNSVDAHLAGVETELRYQREGRAAYAQASFQRATDSNTDEALPGAPALVVQTGGYMRARAGTFAAQVVASSETRGFESAVPSDAWWMLHATYSTPKLWDRVRARVQLRNAFDAQRTIPQVSSLRFETISQPGRQIRFSLSATLR